MRIARGSLAVVSGLRGRWVVSVADGRTIYTVSGRGSSAATELTQHCCVQCVPDADTLHCVRPYRRHYKDMLHRTARLPLIIRVMLSDIVPVYLYLGQRVCLPVRSVPIAAFTSLAFVYCCSHAITQRYTKHLLSCTPVDLCHTFKC